MTRPEDEIARLYAEHSGGLVRLATLLVRDVQGAEDVVQDAFLRTHSAWWRLRDPQRATAYLRRSVVNGCHSWQRRRVLRERHDVTDSLDVTASAEVLGLASLAGRQLIDTMAALPRRQREVLFLRYYLSLSEAEIANTLGISSGSVKTHASRALSALRLQLEAYAS